MLSPQYVVLQKGVQLSVRVPVRVSVTLHVNQRASGRPSRSGAMKSVIGFSKCFFFLLFFLGLRSDRGARTGGGGTSSSAISP